MPSSAPLVASADPAPRPADTVGVLAVLVCHEGGQWLDRALDALRSSAVRPGRVIAVDTGSRDGTAETLGRASDVVDAVLTLPRDTGFGNAVRAALADAGQRWTQPSWLWLLHDDSAPEAGCLGALLSVAELSPAAAVLGPLCLDWDDPRLVIEAGLSTDVSGHRQTGIGPDELDLGQFSQNTEVLAVGSAGSLVRRDVWAALGGYDPALPLLRDDLDFGWRVNRAGHLVLCVPAARLAHARAGGARRRASDATAGGYRRVDRRHGLRTFLTNCSTTAFLLGRVRLPALCLVRALCFLLVRRTTAGRAELAALRYLVTGSADLRAARRLRRSGIVTRSRNVRGLLTSRTTRLRNLVRGGLTGLVRSRLRDELALGLLPPRAVPDGARPAGALPGAAREPATPARRGIRVGVGPSALPKGAVGRDRSVRPTGGLRRPAGSVAVLRPPEQGRPSPVRRSRPAAGRPGREPTTGPSTTGPSTTGPSTTGPSPAAPSPAGPSVLSGAPADLVVVPIGRRRLTRELLATPPLLLVLALAGLALLVHRGRLGLALSGGRLLPPDGLAATWSGYLAEWHPVAGGTAAPAPAAAALVGAVGAVFAPVGGFSGGPAAALSVLLLGALPLAGLTGYLATRALRASRWTRALGAALYAVNPVTTAAVGQGRVDVVVAVVLLPLVLAGVVAVLRGTAPQAAPGAWLSAACGTALALAVVSAFAPLVHLLVLVLALVGFVLTPAPSGVAPRRALALFIVVLLPVGLLLPWPAVVVAHNSVLLHGVGATVAETRIGVRQLLTLDPGGAGSVSWVGGSLLVAAIVLAALRRRRAVLPGLAVAAVGVGAAAVVTMVRLVPLAGGPAGPGWTGAPLALAACGALWSVLAAQQSFPDRAAAGSPRQVPPRLLAVRAAAAVALLVVLAGGTVLRGEAGPLAVRPVSRLDPSVAAGLAADGTAAVEVAGDGSAREAGPRLPRFGDDDLAPVRAEPQRLQRDVAGLLGGEPGVARAAVADLAVSGTALLVLPDAATAERVRSAGGIVLSDGAPTSDGRPTLRVRLPVGGAVVLEPPLSDDATGDGRPPEQPGARGVAPIPARLPSIAVRVSAGASDRLLVVAAAEEPGWSASVNGSPVPVVRAWGHLVAVPLPAGQADVRVDRSGTGRALLLLIEVALLLFTVLTALPPRRRDD